MSDTDPRQIVPVELQADREQCASSISNRQEKHAEALFKSHAHFGGANHSVKVRCFDGRLYLSGKLPSYYLKQLAQEAVRSIEGITNVENQIVVESPAAEVKTGGKRTSTNPTAR